VPTKAYNLLGMKDGKLSSVGDRYELRFTRTLAHPQSKVWAAITTAEGLRDWFPFDVNGSRETGAELTFSFREGEADDFHGSMVEYTPESAMELAWDGETLRLELAPVSGGCALTLINTFAEIGIAARNAAGWHVCLDKLKGESTDWQDVHAEYVAEFGPEAATVGPFQ